MNRYERQQDILKIIQNLDISPTMYKNAMEKYHSITHYLEAHGIQADMYPQGSFALGTVVRPIVKDPNAAYDLDFICQVWKDRDQLTAADLRKEVESILRSSDLYGGKLEVFDKCFTIHYADIGGIGFSIDIVPAADENAATKRRLVQKSLSPALIQTAIAIPKQCEHNYRWITNNPKGYRAWFDAINKPFSIVADRAQRQRIFQENRTLYAHVEDIPQAIFRSSVQRVIQILKYHRNVFYSAFHDGDDTKPISAIISTIVAQTASTMPATTSVFDLLQYVLTEFTTYGYYQTITEKRFSECYPGKKLIRKENGKWVIENPANPEDNLADQWNLDSKIPQRFFRWIHAAHDDLVNALALEDAEFRAKMETAFRPDIVSTAWMDKYQLKTPTPISSTAVPRPWKKQ